MRKFLLFALAGVALLPMTAFAADMGAPVYKAPPPPPPAPVYNWTGCYVDGGAGYGLWNQDHSMTGPYGPGGAVETTVTTHDGGRGWLGRFGGGCDYQFSAGGWGNWVVGVFGDYDFMNLTGSNSPSEVFDFAPPTGFSPITANLNQRDAGYVGGRIGYLLTPGILTYWDGGWTRTRFTQSSEFGTAFGTPINFGYPSFNQNGWFLGGGTEVSLSSWGVPIQGLFWRSEYRYASYGNTDVAEVSTITGLPDGNVEHMKAAVQTITTSLVWRFNWFGH